MRAAKRRNGIDWRTRKGRNRFATRSRYTRAEWQRAQEISAIVGEQLRAPGDCGYCGRPIEGDNWKYRDGKPVHNVCVVAMRVAISAFMPEAAGVQ